MKIYGVLNADNVHIDVSRTEKGAKRYATMNGFNIVSYRIEYNAFKLVERINGKWYATK